MGMSSGIDVLDPVNAGDSTSAIIDCGPDMSVNHIGSMIFDGEHDATIFPRLMVNCRSKIAP
jgi:hypothetical protein